MTSNIYQKRLVGKRREIRLLKLEGVDLNGNIQCNLTTVSLAIQPFPCFNALSYVWGATTPRKAITVNGVPTTVTANLELALRTLRDRPPSVNLPRVVIDTPIWIDALCINQDDLEERGQQVSIMDVIYGAARLVLIFLGKGDPQTDWAIERLSDAEFQRGMHDLGVNNLANARRLTEDQIRVMYILAHNVIRRPWWSRMWVIQELVLASRDPIMICGSKDIQWSEYSELYEIGVGFCAMFALSSPERWKEVGQTMRSYPPISSAIFDWRRIRDRYHEKGALRFINIFPTLLKSQATDSRDLIYGCLGLACHEDSSKIAVDYTRPVMDVFQDVAALIWTSTDHKALTKSVQRFSFNRDPYTAQYPSWVPDFRAQVLEESEWFTSSGLYAGPLSDEAQIWRSSTITLGGAGRVLKIQGVVMDSIREECHVDRFYGSGVSSLEASGLDLLLRIEDMIVGGKGRHIGPSHPLYTLRDLKAVESVPQILANFMDAGIQDGSDADPSLLWDALLGRRQSCTTSQTYFNEPGNGQEGFDSDMLVPLLEALDRRVAHRKVFLTNAGFAGVGTANLETGDVVVLPCGASCLYLLRPLSSGYNMIGFAYVSGLWHLDRIDIAVQNGFLKEIILDIH